MKVLHLSTSDSGGGAFNAARRLHQGLQVQGAESGMLVQTTTGSDTRVTAKLPRHGQQFAFLRYFLDALPALASRRGRGGTFTPAFLPDSLAGDVGLAAPDLVHLHWVAGGFLRLETLARLKRPLVWTLHDSWPFTGGCHVPQECRRYMDSCGACPQLSSRHEFDLSRMVWNRKQKAWRQLSLALVAPSRWMARCAGDSSLFRERRIEVIPNGLDLESVHPVDKVEARRALGLPEDRQLVLFGAVRGLSDSNKGAQYLVPALEKLARAGLGQKVELLVFGRDVPEQTLDLGLPTRYLGYFENQQDLNRLYSAADLFLAPSRQENLPCTVMEAMACGTPCVGFDIGGMPDLITHGVDGYLARPFSPESLAEGMVWLLSAAEGGAPLRKACRLKVETQFDIRLCAQRHLDFYRDILAGGTAG
ncbi:Glycosyl transferase, group 1 family protein [Citrifermentans bremense]|uniref:Glycosyl transferase, group 1 family protein n=1 Tax=Citrifermentans bremense TaxID=60035 RepID=A0A6S6LY32_9BACT|nr:glycosyltransferase family 4 protein [Citrifermentans bremense]BCG46932.1 Glycosyl transferase, group 1 family protein [Citrifermentans bremense]